MKQKVPTPHNRRQPLSRYERILMRRPCPEAAENWWYRLLPIERAVIHLFIKGVQMATDTEAMHAVHQFRDADAEFLQKYRDAWQRHQRQQRRQARARKNDQRETLALTA